MSPTSALAQTNNNASIHADGLDTIAFTSPPKLAKICSIVPNQQQPTATTTTTKYVLAKIASTTVGSNRIKNLDLSNNKIIQESPTTTTAEQTPNSASILSSPLIKLMITNSKDPTLASSSVGSPLSSPSSAGSNVSSTSSNSNSNSSSVFFGNAQQIQQNNVTISGSLKSNESSSNVDKIVVAPANASQDCISSNNTTNNTETNQQLHISCSSYN